jgi:hypothetical protein
MLFYYEKLAETMRGLRTKINIYKLKMTTHTVANLAYKQKSTVGLCAFFKRPQMNRLIFLNVFMLRQALIFNEPIPQKLFWRCVKPLSLPIPQKMKGVTIATDKC